MAISGMELWCGGRRLAADVRELTGFWERGVGFMGKPQPEPGYGFLFRKCGSLHTWGMRFRLDIVFLDADWRVLRVRRDVGPWRMVVGGRGAKVAIEVPAGTLGEVAVGEVVELRDVE